MSRQENKGRRKELTGPRRPEWREKLRRLIEEARADVQKEEGEGHDKPTHT